VGGGKIGQLTESSILKYSEKEGKNKKKEKKGEKIKKRHNRGKKREGRRHIHGVDWRDIKARGNLKPETKPNSGTQGSMKSKRVSFSSRTTNQLRRLLLLKGQPCAGESSMGSKQGDQKK